MDKKKNFTEYEKTLMFQCLLPWKEVVENKKIDKASMKEKNAAWAKVAELFNSDKDINQQATSKQLQRLWTNIKNKRKDNLTDFHQQQCVAGGSPPPPPVQTHQEMEIIAEIITGIQDENSQSVSFSTAPIPHSDPSTTTSFCSPPSNCASVSALSPTSPLTFVSDSHSNLNFVVNLPTTSALSSTSTTTSISCPIMFTCVTLPNTSASDSSSTYSVPTSSDSCPSTLTSIVTLPTSLASSSTTTSASVSNPTVPSASLTKYHKRRQTREGNEERVSKYQEKLFVVRLESEKQKLAYQSKLEEEKLREVRQRISTEQVNTEIAMIRREMATLEKEEVMLRVQMLKDKIKRIDETES